MQKTIEEVREMNLDNSNLLDILGEVLTERKALYDALKHVQGRCTEIEWKSVRLKLS